MSSVEQQRKIVQDLRRAQRDRHRPSVLQIQSQVPRKAPIRGSAWICADTMHVSSETTVRDTLFDVILHAKKEDIVLPSRTAVMPIDVIVEWVGQRKGGSSREMMPEDGDVFQKLQSDVVTDATILYCHGGGYFEGSHVSARATTTKLARLSQARVVSVDYRLSPQSQFPAALLDLILVYLDLLYPGPSARHSPTNPRSLIIAGESSGGSLCLSLAQFILALSRKQAEKIPKIEFRGRKVTLPMPAGFAMLSAEADRTFALPSFEGNQDFDIFIGKWNVNENYCPPDEVWPSSPPRHDVYCHSSVYLHPLANPIVAADWYGSAPLWFAYGQERCLDSGKAVAATAIENGVKVVFTEYQGMPHIFGVILPNLPQSERVMREWAAFCCQVAVGEQVENSARHVLMPGSAEEILDPKHLFSLRRDEFMLLVREAARKKEIYTGSIKAHASL